MQVEREEQRWSIDQLLDCGEQVHSAPPVAMKILQITRDPEFAIDDVVNCLNHDPALTASILRLVNSSIFGLSHQVGSLRQAVALLGRRSLRLTVVSFGMVKHLCSGIPAELYSCFWRRSLSMACAARYGAGRLSVHPDEAFTAALLADLGMLILAQVDPDNYIPMVMDVSSGDQLVEREIARYGFDHASVTGRLLTRWQLPDELVAATLRHHQSDTSEAFDDDLTMLVRMANLTADVLGTPSSNSLQPLQSMLTEHFSYDTDDFIELALNCKHRVQESAEVFQVHLTDRIDIEALRREAQRQFEATALAATLDLDSLEAVVQDNSTLQDQD